MEKPEGIRHPYDILKPSNFHMGLAMVPSTQHRLLGIEHLLGLN